MLELNTFGNSESAQNLVKMINEKKKKKVTTNISRFLVSNNKIIHALAQIEDNEVQKTLYQLYKASFSNVELKEKKKIKTHAINVLVGRLRDEVIRK